MPLKIIKEDITKLKVDVIVNSANPKPSIGGGVDYAIHHTGGEELVKARIALGEIGIAEAKVNKGYNLPSKYVIQTVGPKWGDGSDVVKKQLYDTYLNSLQKAKELKAKSIAFPLISAGVFGFPPDQSLSIATKASEKFLEDNDMMIFIVIYETKENICYLPQIEYNRIKVYLSAVEKYHHDHPSLLEDVPELKEPLSAIMAGRVSCQIADDRFKLIDMTWQESLFELIDRKGYKDSYIYKKANMDRRLFSKIRSQRNYHPSKPTIVSLCIALELNLDETLDFLKKAGYNLSFSIRFDIIIRYYISRGVYDIYEINNTLFQFDQELLGSF